MAYDEGLAERIRGLLDERSDVTEKMFGGVAFMVRGHMAVGVVKDDLMVRVGPEAYGALVREPHARRMDFTGRPMKGFVYVASTGLETGLLCRIGWSMVCATPLHFQQRRFQVSGWRRTSGCS